MDSSSGILLLNFGLTLAKIQITNYKKWC